MTGAVQVKRRSRGLTNHRLMGGKKVEKRERVATEQRIDCRGVEIDKTVWPATAREDGLMLGYYSLFFVVGVLARVLKSSGG